jgi:glycosyltransferase involved in cell wall biosynthesis
MRVLFVHEKFGAFAGAETNLLQTANELNQRGHTVSLLHGARTGRGEAAWREAFSTRYELQASDHPVKAALRDFGPDAIYIHNMSDLRVLEELVGCGVPAARMVHDHNLYCLRSYKYNYFTRRICTRPASPYCVFPCCAVVARGQNGHPRVQWDGYQKKKREIELNKGIQRLVVATEYMREELLRNGFDPGAIEIHAPVPPAAESGVQCSFGARNRIVYAGQIIRGKGVDILLESLALVSVPFECHVFGDGNHRSYCETLCRSLGLENRVTFHGFVPQAELRRHYQDCSLAVMSSVWPEPFGAAGLEAMRYGLPIVAFDAGGIREWLIDGQNGLLVPWMDRARFATAVERLLLNKSFARDLGERGRQFAAEKYDFDRYVSGLEEMFGRIINQPCKPVCA